MKKCPTCNRTYADETLSFCLEDGALLSRAYDPDETLVLGANDPTVHATNPDYNPEKSPSTGFTQTRQTSAAIAGMPASKTSPHLIYAGAGLVAVITIVFGLIYMSSGRTNEVASQGTPKIVTAPNVVAITPVPQPTVFREEVTVPSTQMWYDTGIDVPAGTPVRIEYRSGQWTNVEGSNYVDGRGKGGFERRGDLIVPSSDLAALVGKVGNNTFPIGNSYFGSPGRGRLYLSMNDTTDHSRTYADNRGALTVLVELNGAASSVSTDRTGNVPTMRQLQDELLKEAKRIEDEAMRR